MRISHIAIDGVKGRVEITRTQAGAAVMLGADGSGDGAFLVCEVGRGDDRDARYAKA